MSRGINMICEKHPKYKAKKYPTSECTKCLTIFFKLKIPRTKIPKNKVFKDKTKYTRKQKYK